MPQIISDTIEATTILDALIKLIIDNGGHIHQDITFIIQNNDLRIESQLDANCNDHILYIPDACLPRYDDYDLYIKDSELHFNPKARASNPTQVLTFGYLIKLFNLTKKLQFHQKHFPGADQPLPDDIIALLNKKDPSAEEQLSRKSRSNEKFLLDTFFHTRYLANKRGNGEFKQTLMPLIDFINHNANALPFATAQSDKGSFMGIIVSHWKPDNASQECFVDYYPLDPISRYLGYGFVDQTANKLHSIPLILEIENVGYIDIANKQPALSDLPNLPRLAELSGIQNYQPSIKFDNKGNMYLSHLAIPIQNRTALNQAIMHFIYLMSGRKIKGKKLIRLGNKAVKQVIKHNINYTEEGLNYLLSRNNNDLTPTMQQSLIQLYTFENDQLKRYLTP